ncbi:MAG: hypothetical protein AABZ80_09170 [Gemmatimonadota bacterium]
MSLVFKHPWMMDARRVYAPRAFSWLVLASLGVLFAWAYLSNPQPGPYGTCYAGRGRPVPCGPVSTKAVDAVALPVTTTP